MPCLLDTKMTGMLPRSFRFYMAGGVSQFHSSCLCCEHFIHCSPPWSLGFSFYTETAFLMGNDTRVLQESGINLKKISKCYLAVGWFPPGPVSKTSVLREQSIIQTPKGGACKDDVAGSSQGKASSGQYLSATPPWACEIAGSSEFRLFIPQGLQQRLSEIIITWSGSL